MNSNTKKISIHRELHEIVIIRRPNRSRMFCPDCLSSVEFLTLDETVNFLQIGTREILRKIEMSEIHSSDASNGQMMVCAKSLAKC